MTARIAVGVSGAGSNLRELVTVARRGALGGARYAERTAR